MWQAAFRSSIDDSAAARDLFDAGLWAHDQLELVRANVASIEKGHASRTELLRLLVGITNSTMQRTLTAAASSLERAELIRSGALNRIDDVAETLIDGVRYPVSEVLKSQPSEKRPSRNAVKALQQGQQLVALGAIYASIEVIWAHCLWLAWRIERQGQRQYAVPVDEERERQRGVGLFRYLSINSQISLLAAEDWRRLPPHARVFETVRVVGIERIGKRKRLVVDSVRLDHIPSQAIFKMVAEELYLSEILEQPLPKLSGVTTQQLVDAWVGLSPLAGIMAERFPVDHLTFETMLNFAPSVSRNAIRDAVSRIISVPKAQADDIVSILTLSGTPREEIWFRPFVPLGDDKMAVFAPALSAPNLLRSIEEWLRVGGIDLSLRGPLFEQYVRDVLRRTNRLMNAYIHPDAVLTDQQTGDIDIWLQIGETVAVCECKCSLLPANPLDRHKYDETLQKAAFQSLTKAQYTRTHLSELAFAVGRPLSAQTKVLPVVVSNLPLGAGSTFGGVPVVDAMMLVKYFSEGFIEQQVIVTPGKPMRVGKRIAFYDTPEQAESNLESYMHQPPQVTTLRSLLRPVPYPLFKSPTHEVGMMNWEVFFEPEKWVTDI